MTVKYSDRTLRTHQRHVNTSLCFPHLQVFSAAPKQIKYYYPAFISVFLRRIVFTPTVQDFLNGLMGNNYQRLPTRLCVFSAILVETGHI